MAPVAGAEIGDAQALPRRLPGSSLADGARHRSASSTTVSVSGRGTNVSAESLSGRPQNSFCRECARRARRRRRRSAQMPRLAFFRGGQRRVALRDQAGEVEAKRRADEQPRVELGELSPAAAKRAVSARRAASMVRGGDGSRSPPGVFAVIRAKAGTHTAGPPGMGGRSCLRVQQRSRWLWVPAFAGTTARVWRHRRITLGNAQTPLTPRRPGRRAARPGARWSARRSVRRALRPRSPAAACRASD